MDKKIFIKPLIIYGLLSFLAICITFAIYRNLTSSSGSVVTAEWNVTLNQNGIDNHLSIIPNPNGTSASYTLNITSNSEVDTIYSIVIDNLPDDVSVAIGNGSPVQEVNNQVVFTDVGTILYSDVNKTKSHVLTFSAASTASYVDDEEVDIIVLARQYIPS